jgi:uncharacterized protein YegJ (DUF2314 family)
MKRCTLTFSCLSLLVLKNYGNYTMRPLLETLPKDDADYYRSLLANP